MKNEKNSKGFMGDMLSKAAYSVGFICAKTTNIGKAVGNKQWKNTVSASKDFMEKAAEKTTHILNDAKEEASHIKDSFMTGFESTMEKLSGKGHTGPVAGSVSGLSGLKAKKPAPDRKDKEAKPEIRGKVNAKVNTRSLKSKQKPRSKVRRKAISEAPLNADLEREIDRIDKNVEEVEGV